MRITNPPVLGRFVHGVVFRYATYFLLVLVIVSVSAVTVFKAEADVAIFYSDNYLEKGVEIAHEEDGKKYIQYEYSWSDFKGSIPEGTFANSITLNLSWSLVTRSLVDVDVTAEDTGSSEGIGVVQVETLASEQILTDETVDDVADEETESEIGEGTLAEIELPVSPELTPEPEQAPVPTESPEASIVPVIEAPVGEGESSETSMLESVPWSTFFSIAHAETEELPFLEATGTDEVIIAESVSTTSGFVSSDIVTVSSSTDFFEVRYTLDGSTWYEIGRIGFDESQETTLDLSSIGIDALPNLHVEVRYTVPAESEKKILIDSLELHVGYDVVPVEEIIEPVGIDDRIPNFEVSSIKADTQSENIRAVLLERGGMLEFWYSITAQDTGEIEWHRLVGGSVIDPSAPIAIKERTIFWLDRNQQTLFGFSVDMGALFGVPFTDPEEKIFLLPFKNRNNESWEAVFNVELNTLEFNKVSNKSS